MSGMGALSPRLVSALMLVGAASGASVLNFGTTDHGACEMTQVCSPEGGCGTYSTCDLGQFAVKQMKPLTALETEIDTLLAAENQTRARLNQMEDTVYNLEGRSHFEHGPAHFQTDAPSESPTAAPTLNCAGVCCQACSGTTCVDGYYSVDIVGFPRHVFCTYQTINGFIYAYDAQLASGRTTHQHTDANSCPMGTDIWVPRSKKVQEEVFKIFKDHADITGIYKPSNGCGGCTDHAMKSGGEQSRHGWTSVASPAEPWILRDFAYSEPNGDYTGNCWLFAYHGAHEGHYDGSGTKFNDDNCAYGASSYVCSTNPAWGATW